MTNKYQWHKEWQRLDNGRLRHSSGIEFEHDDILGWETCNETMEQFQSTELARGVPIHDLINRVTRLAKEAAMWAADPRNAQ